MSPGQAPPASAGQGGGEVPSDRDLILGVARRDEEAFRILFRRWAPRLQRLLTQATGSRETGEELLQEAFLRVLQAAPRFEPRGAAGAWIHRIAVNLAYSHWRRRKAAPFSPAGDRAVPDAPATDDPAGALERRVFAAAAREALQRLPENQRMVFLLKVDQGLTYEEIGEVLAIPAGTAKSRLHHAVMRLRAELIDWADAPAAPRDGRWRKSSHGV